MRKSGPFADGLEENLLLEELWALLLPAHDRDLPLAGLGVPEYPAWG